MAYTLTTVSSRVYVDLPDPIPPHPGKSWTRFVCISDTHSRCDYPIPSGDVLLHAGDLSSWGSFTQLQLTVDWLKSMDHPVKLIIAGNHDICLDKKWEETIPEDVEIARSHIRSPEVRDAGIHYLEHESFQFMTQGGRKWRVYGSPATHVYAEGAFQYAGSEEADELYERIPEDTEILITHTPPYGWLDKTRRGKHAGCERLTARLANLHDCRLHVFGHIHEGHGAQFFEKGDSKEEAIAVNAALRSFGQAIVVDLEN